MTKYRQFILHASFLCLVCITGHAVPVAKDPIKITAAKATFDNKTGIATYTGQVVVKQGLRTLRANQLVIQRGANHKIQLMTATGKPATFDSRANPAKPGSGKANTIKYYPDTEKVELLQNASITQNGDTVSGSKLTYNFVTEELQGNSSPKERTTVILNSKRAP